MTDATSLHVDSDWKAQAEAERERLAKAEAQARQAAGAAGAGGAPQELPPADMQSLMGVIASQALAGLGMYGDRESGRMIVDFEGAKFAIDLLAVLEEKTKGNLSDDEARELKSILAELRTRFVQLLQVVERQAAKGGAQPIGGASIPAAGGPAPAGATSTAAPAAAPSKLIIPG